MADFRERLNQLRSIRDAGGSSTEYRVLSKYEKLEILALESLMPILETVNDVYLEGKGAISVVSGEYSKDAFNKNRRKYPSVFDRWGVRITLTWDQDFKKEDDRTYYRELGVVLYEDNEICVGQGGSIVGKGSKIILGLEGWEGQVERFLLSGLEAGAIACHIPYREPSRSLGEPGGWSD